MIFIVQLSPSLKLKLWTKANTIITVNICCSDFSPDLHLTLELNFQALSQSQKNTILELRSPLQLITMFGLRRGRLAPSQIMIFIVQLGPSLKLKLWTKVNTIITVNICFSDIYIRIKNNNNY